MTMQQSLSKTVLLAALALGASSAAWAHASLQSATPAKDTEVAASPEEIVLRFNEKLEAAFSNARLVDSNGKAVSTAKAALLASEPSVMKLAVPPLAPGKYTVQFTVVGHDGHRRKGEYSFSVK